MKNSATLFIKNLPYLCLIGVIALGLITIVGSNGDEDGAGTSTTAPSTTADTSSDTDTDTSSDSDTLLLQGTLLVGLSASSIRDAGEKAASTENYTAQILDTVTGEQNTGAVIRATTPASGYSVVVVNNASNRIYHATSDSEGAFSLEVPSGSSYLLSLINNGSYLGPTVFDGSGSEVNTAITPSSNTDLGAITVDTTNGYGRASTAPDCVNTEVTAVATDSRPVGAGNDGKTQQSGITNRADSDKDMDGVPNMFDADEDNDGIRNGIASTPSGATVVSDVVETASMSSNIWADHNTSSEAKDLIALWLYVTPVSGQESQISSVQCIDVPASIEDVATIRWSGSIGDPSGYPTENSLWKDASYNLYQTTTLSQEKWIVSITPRAIMNVGDTFTIRVTYTDSSYEDFFVTTSYVLTDWAKIMSYNGTAMPTTEGIKTDPVNYDSDNLEITFSKPRDEDGNILEGLRYSIIYGESDCSTGTCSVPNNVTEDTVVDTGADTLTANISTTNSATYYVTPVAESSDGQRNGEETWFTRE